MIKNFEDFEKVEVSIIPRLREFNELTLSTGDTLVIYWDFINYPMEMAEEFFRIVQKAFPNNSVLFLPIESKMEVVKNGK
mgnify:CR=1 FL=1